MVAQQFSTAHVLVLFTHATGDSDKQLFRMGNLQELSGYPVNIPFNQWPFQEPRLEVPTIYFRPIFQALISENIPTIHMAKHMVPGIPIDSTNEWFLIIFLY